jgi:hypothetical protein
MWIFIAVNILHFTSLVANLVMCMNVQGMFVFTSSSGSRIETGKNLQLPVSFNSGFLSCFHIFLGCFRF